MSSRRVVLQCLFVSCIAASLGACVTAPPLAPSFTVLPKQGEPFEVFQKNDASCRSYASSASGEPSTQQAQSDQAASAAVGTGIGAAAGALIGSSSGQAGQGAAVGAGTGLLVGAIVGQGRVQQSTEMAQQLYDRAYAQCMSAHGELLPMPAPAPRPIYVVPAPPPVAVYPA